MKKKIITGNYYNKFESKKFIEKLLVNRYKYSFIKTIRGLNISTCFEIGSGEGNILQLVENNFLLKLIIGSDIDFDLIHEDKIRNKSRNRLICDAHFLPIGIKKIDLLLACEVLEHLSEPQLFLEECSRIDARYFFFTIPNEPLWRLLNILRLKYIKDLGNTPGHMNHWSKNKIRQLISRYLDVKDLFFVQPWIFIIAQPKK